MLTSDAEADVRETAEATLAKIPAEALAAFLGRSEVSEGLRAFFRSRGVEPAVSAPAENDEPLVDTEPSESGDEAAAGETQEPAETDAERKGAAQRLSLLTVAERMSATAESMLA